MRKNIIITIISLLFLCFELQAYSIHPNAGETSATFLKVAPGGASVSMGEAGTAYSSDVFGVWWNPAAAGDINRKKAGFAYNSWIQDLYKNYAVLVFPLYEGESLAFIIDSLIVPPTIERRSGSFEDDEYNPVSSSEGEFGAYDLMAGITYSRGIGDRIVLGSTLKGIVQNIDDVTAYSAALDAGIRYKSSRNLRLGLSVKNFGQAVRFENSAYNLPFTVNLGVAYFALDNLILVTDINKAVDNYLKIKAGFQYNIWQKIFLRAGYIIRYSGLPLGAASGLRSGMGFRMGRFNFDYSFAPYSFLGQSHRISLQYSFGKKVKKRPRKDFYMNKTDKVDKNKETFKDTSGISVKKEMISSTASGILWDINCSLKDSPLKKISYKIIDKEKSMPKFSISSSTNIPTGFYPGENMKAEYYISVKTTMKKEIIKSDMIFELNDKNNYFILPKKGKIQQLEKIKDSLYAFKNSGKLIGEFLILSYSE